MNFKPILFSTEMVKAILSGSKVQTRRVVKDKHAPFKISKDNQYAMGLDQLLSCPYGQVGDVLWVRETFAKIKSLETGLTYSLPKADFEYYKDKLIQGEKVKWKSSIHMPKEACRLFLQIKSIRVEMLNDITEGDACLEGVELMDTNRYKDYIDKHNSVISSRISFATLWQSINGEESWNSNPWVWVIEFERIEKPKNF